jgi:hypothetical protein
MNPQLINSQRIERFLQRLSECYRRPGQLYLVGGSSLILIGGKLSTLDIDLQFQVDPADHGEFVRCLRQVSRELNLAVEQASPEQFIPLPSGYQDRCQFIGRYDKLDVYHFDFYSLALSKLYRGNQKDFVDVQGMIQRQIISMAELTAYYEELLPLLEIFSIHAQPEAFARKFDRFIRLIQEDIASSDIK